MAGGRQENRAEKCSQLLWSAITHCDSNISKGFIEATVECKSERMPRQVMLRIPHPYWKNAREYYQRILVSYASESVSIMPFTGKADIIIEY